MVYPQARSASRTGNRRLCVRTPCYRRNRQVSRVPLPDFGVTSIGETYPASSEDITPPSSLIRTHAPIPFGSPLLRRCLVGGVFAGCYQPLLPPGSSRRYLCQSFSRCLDPYHDGLQVAFTCCFPCNIGLPQKSYGSACRETPLKRLRSGGDFRGCSHFFMFRPPDLLATLVAPTSTVSCGADGDFYVRARHALLPPHAPDMLAVRNRQLTARGLSPRQTRSLVGRSALSSPTTCRFIPTLSG